jgi:phage FluMu gp28-like protein
MEQQPTKLEVRERPPVVLLGYQRRWVADTSRVRVWEKSRRIGASWTCASEAALEAARTNGDDTWYIGYNKEMAEEFIDDVGNWSRAYRIAASSVAEDILADNEREILTYLIRFSSGHRVTALSSRPTNLRGKQGRVIIDEAAFHDHMGELLKSGFAVLMWGGRVDILSTHNGVDSEFNKLVDDIRSERKGYSLHKTTIDDAIADGLCQRIFMTTGVQWSPEAESNWLGALLDDYGDAADEELRCVPMRSGGTYLSRQLIEDRMFDAPVFRYEAPANFSQRPDDQREREMTSWLTENIAGTLAALPKECMHALGEDFGRNADLTVIAPVTITQKLQRRMPFLLELRDTPFREQEVAFKFVADRLPNFTYGALDAGGNGQYMAERACQKYGSNRIEPINLSDAWYGEHFPKLKAAFEDDLIALPRDADVLADLLSVQVIGGTPRLPPVRKKQIALVGTRNVKRHGDAAVAILLAHYASRQPVCSCDGYQSAVRRSGAVEPRMRMAGGFRSRPGGVF